MKSDASAFMRAVLMTMVVVVISGCSAGPARTVDGPVLHDRSIVQEYALSLSEIGAGPAHQSVGTNCISFPNGVRIINGSISAAWRAATPATEQLELWFSEFSNVDSRDVVHLPPTRSPLRASVENVTGQIPDAHFIIHLQVPNGAAPDQAATLRIEFNYTADGELKPLRSSCASN